MIRLTRLGWSPYNASLEAYLIYASIEVGIAMCMVAYYAGACSASLPRILPKSKTDRHIC